MLYEATHGLVEIMNDIDRESRKETESKSGRID